MARCALQRTFLWKTSARPWRSTWKVHFFWPRNRFFLGGRSNPCRVESRGSADFRTCVGPLASPGSWSLPPCLLSKSSVVSITKPRHQRAIKGVKFKSSTKKNVHPFYCHLPPHPTTAPRLQELLPLLTRSQGRVLHISSGAAHRRPVPGWMVGIHGLSTFSSKKGMKFTFKSTAPSGN